MHHSLRVLRVSLLLISCCLISIIYEDRVLLAETPKNSSTMFTLEQTDHENWYRGNLHTHSHWSDGNDYLANIALWYRNNGYQFLCFTDHNVLANKERWIDVKKSKGGQVAFDKLKKNFPDHTTTRMAEGRLEVKLNSFQTVSQIMNRDGEFLLIQGEEISDRFSKYPIHLNASNVQELIIPRGGKSVAETIQNNVTAVIKQKEKTGKPILVHLNHPNFGYAVRAEDLMGIIGENFFEVYNGHPAVHNQGDHIHVSTERMWDIILTMRLAELDLPIMYGIAVDDSHEYHHIPSRRSEPGRGWVSVLSKELSPKAIINSLESGRFYASSGVKLLKVERTAGQLTVEVDAKEDETYTIEFIGTRLGYDRTRIPVEDKNGKPLHATHIYSKDIGQVLAKENGNKASYKFRGDEIYVRVRITSSAHHPNPAELHEHKMAWVQPTAVASRPKKKSRSE